MVRLKDLTVNWISLVKRPANGKELTLKTADNQIASAFTFTKFEVKKSDADNLEDERMAYGIVYSPHETDLQGDTADSTTIRRAAYEFMRAGRLKNIDTEHDFNPKLASVVESWIVRKNDEIFSDGPVGSWAVGIQIGDPELWTQLKSGELTGLSLAGFAREERTVSDEIYAEKSKNELGLEWFQSFIKSAGIKIGLLDVDDTNLNGDTDMKEEDVKALVKTTVVETVGPAVTAAISPAIAAAFATQKATGDVPVGDPPAAAAAVGDEPAGNQAGGKGREEMITKSAAQQMIGDAVAKALAKGETETDGITTEKEESFL